MRVPRSAPLRYLLLLTGVWLALFALTRLTLLLTHLDEAGHAYLSAFGVGLAYDLGFLLYAALPLATYLLLCPPACGARVPTASCCNWCSA